MPRAEWGWIDVGRYTSGTFGYGGGDGGGNATTGSNAITVNAWTTNSTATQSNWHWRNNVYTYTYTYNGTIDAVRGRRRPDAGRDERLNEERRVRDVARTAARDRAEALLLSMLSEEQRESYRVGGTFLVVGSAGGVYRIRRGVSGNVDWLGPNGEVAGVLCAHPEMAEQWMPAADVAVAQLLALTTDEPAFVRVANVHRGRRPPMPRRPLAVA